MLRATSRLALNRQVLHEVYWVVSRKRAFAPARRWIRPVLRTYSAWACIEDRLGDLETAWILKDRHGAPFWDALLLAAASRGGCGIFLSEDLNDGQIYDGVRVLNPIRHPPDELASEVTGGGDLRATLD